MTRALRTVLVGLLLAITSCTSTPFSYKPSRPTPPLTDVVIDHAAIKLMAGSTALFRVYKLYQVPTEDGKIVLVPQSEWTGSAFCIGIGDDTITGKKFSVWATCRHVAEMESSMFATIDYLDASGYLKRAPVRNVRLSPNVDLAIAVADVIPLAFLKVASRESVTTLPIGQFLVASGCPMSVYPPVVTIGVFIGYGHEGKLRTTTGGYYGSSGSPLIDPRTMEVVGVISNFGGAQFFGKFRSDDLMAVPADLLIPLVPKASL